MMFIADYDEAVRNDWTFMDFDEYLEYLEEEFRKLERKKRLRNWEKCYQVAETPKILPNGKVVGIEPFEFEEPRKVMVTEDEKTKNEPIVDEKQKKYKRCCTIL